MHSHSRKLETSREENFPEKKHPATVSNNGAYTPVKRKGEEIYLETKKQKKADTPDSVRDDEQYPSSRYENRRYANNRESYNNKFENNNANRNFENKRAIDSENKSDLGSNYRKKRKYSDTDSKTILDLLLKEVDKDDLEKFNTIRIKSFLSECNFNKTDELYVVGELFKLVTLEAKKSDSDKKKVAGCLPYLEKIIEYTLEKIKNNKYIDTPKYILNALSYQFFNFLTILRCINDVSVDDHYCNYLFVGELMDVLLKDNIINADKIFNLFHGIAEYIKMSKKDEKFSEHKHNKTFISQFKKEHIAKIIEYILASKPNKLYYVSKSLWSLGVIADIPELRSLLYDLKSKQISELINLFVMLICDDSKRSVKSGQNEKIEIDIIETLVSLAKLSQPASSFLLEHVDEKHLNLIIDKLISYIGKNSHHLGLSGLFYSFTEINRNSVYNIKSDNIKKLIEINLTQKCEGYNSYGLSLLSITRSARRLEIPLHHYIDHEKFETMLTKFVSHLNAYKWDSIGYGLLTLSEMIEGNQSLHYFNQNVAQQIENLVNHAVKNKELINHGTTVFRIFSLIAGLSENGQTTEISKRFKKESIEQLANFLNESQKDKNLFRLNLRISTVLRLQSPISDYFPKNITQGLVSDIIDHSVKQNVKRGYIIIDNLSAITNVLSAVNKGYAKLDDEYKSKFIKKIESLLEMQLSFIQFNRLIKRLYHDCPDLLSDVDFKSVREKIANVYYDYPDALQKKLIQFCPWAKPRECDSQSSEIKKTSNSEETKGTLLQNDPKILARSIVTEKQQKIPAEQGSEASQRKPEEGKIKSALVGKILPVLNQRHFKLIPNKESNVKGIKITISPEGFNPYNLGDIKLLKQYLKENGFGDFIYDSETNKKIKLPIKIAPMEVLHGGLGIIATADFTSSNNGVVTYTGEVSKEIVDAKSQYIFEITNSNGEVVNYIDAKRLGDWTRFINHSINPNVVTDQYKQKAIHFTFVLPIEKSHHITFDYSNTYWEAEDYHPYFLHFSDNSTTRSERFNAHRDQYADIFYQFDENTINDLELTCNPAGSNNCKHEENVQWLVPKLLLAVAQKNVEDLEAELNKAKARIKQDKESKSLNLAACINPIELVAYACRGNEILASDEQQHISPFMLASYLGSERCLDVLLKAGADVDRCSLRSGLTPFMLLCKGHANDATLESCGKKILKKSQFPFGTDRNQLSTLHYAIKRNSVTLVKKLLDMAVQDENQDLFTVMFNRKRNLPAHADFDYCILNGQFEMLTVLLERVIKNPILLPDEIKNYVEDGMIFKEETFLATNFSNLKEFKKLIDSRKDFRKLFPANLYQKLNDYIVRRVTIMEKEKDKGNAHTLFAKPSIVPLVEKLSQEQTNIKRPNK